MKLLLATATESGERHLEELAAVLGPKDLVIVNDAATLPAAFAARDADGHDFELRLATQLSARRWTCIAMGSGSHRVDTNRRPAPPKRRVGEELRLHALDGSSGSLAARIASVLDEESRLIEVDFELSGTALLERFFELGTMIQYAYHQRPLPASWLHTPYAGAAWAVEMPSAGRYLGVELIARLRRRGVQLAWLTHAAGPSATGSPQLDARLPLAERYRIPQETVDAIRRCREAGGRVIAVGTTVVRALEGCVHDHGHVRPGPGRTSLRLGPEHELRVVDGLLCGLHGPGESHFELLRSFRGRDELAELYALGERRGFQNHELGDLMFVLAERPS